MDVAAIAREDHAAEVADDSEALRSYIRRIRKNLGRHKLIITHRGYGYAWSRAFDTTVIERGDQHEHFCRGCYTPLR